MGNALKSQLRGARSKDKEVWNPLRTLSLREWLSEARLEDPHAFEFPSVNMINGDEQRSTETSAAKRKATCRRHIPEKEKSQDRRNPGPSDRIRSGTTERPNERKTLLDKEWDPVNHPVSTAARKDDLAYPLFYNGEEDSLDLAS